MKARYIRVSTPNQNLERQLEEDYPTDNLFIDIISGSVPFSERNEATRLLDSIKDGKTTYLTVKSIDRLGRNLVDILSTIEALNESNVPLKVDNLGIESLINGKPNSAFKLIISVMANIAEMERETLLERQREGIAIAKAKGVYKGRIRGTTEPVEQFLSKYKKVITQLKKGKSLRDVAKLCDVSLGTVQKVKSYYFSKNAKLN